VPRQEEVFLPGHRFGSKPERCPAIFFWSLPWWQIGKDYSASSFVAECLPPGGSRPDEA